MPKTANWIETYTGRRFYPLDPEPEDVSLPDIAHSLANTCRFTGHCMEFYSVAQHSVLVSQVVPPIHAMAGLFHDAAEAYLADLASPVKHDPRFAVFCEYEDRILQVIAGVFGFEFPLDASVKEYDRQMLVTECEQLMISRGKDWVGMPEPLSIEIKPPMTPYSAKRFFVERYYQILEDSKE